MIFKEKGFRKSFLPKTLLKKIYWQNYRTSSLIFLATSASRAYFVFSAPNFLGVFQRTSGTVNYLINYLDSANKS
jgi:hypothetical protein